MGHNTENLRLWRAFLFYLLCGLQSNLKNLTCKGETGFMEVQEQQLPSGHVAVRKLYNQESARPGCWPENTKCWLMVDQNSGLVLKNKAQSSCSLFRPLLCFPHLGKGALELGLGWNQRCYATWALGITPLCSILDLALRYPEQTFNIPWLRLHKEGIMWRWYFLWVQVAESWGGRRKKRMEKRDSQEYFKIYPRRRKTHIYFCEKSPLEQKCHSFPWTSPQVIPKQTEKL